MDWPTGKYGAILADPPWHFNAWSKYKPLASGGHSRAVQRYYSTMKTDDIAGIPVKQISAQNCALFLWACWPNFLDALNVLETWGFKYKTMAFVWVKGAGLPLFPDDVRDQVGLGYWTRANTEPCILATRGRPRRKAADVREVILDKRREHSRKPDEVYERIERLVDGPYLELFARQQRPGWTAWGNEVDKFAPPAR